MSEISMRSLHKLFEAGLLVTSNTNFESLISYRFSLPENLISASAGFKGNFRRNFNRISWIMQQISFANKQYCCVFP